MIYLQLFWSFLKIGFTSFGGLSMVPLISSEMTSHGWMTAGEVTDIVAIAEMTPGPLGLNCATFAGIRAAGLGGALAANCGVLMPTLTLCLLAAVFFEKFRKAKVMQQIMVGIRPACLAMIAGICLTLSAENYTGELRTAVPSVCLGVLDTFLLLKCKWSITAVILFSGGLGLLIFGVVPMFL